VSTLVPPQLRTQEERDRLIQQYLPLVHHVVARLPVTMPSTLGRDDFYSVGVIGLMHAARTYDPGRGASFKTFAFTAIRGAILDEIRRHDPVPRSRRDRLRRVERASGALQATLDRAPTLEELAEHLGLTSEELDGDLLALHTCRLLSLDDTLPRPGSVGENLGASIEGNDIAPPDAAMHRERIDDLAQAIGELPETDRTAIVLYYYENLFLKEIGEILGVSESRVSQILSRAVARLRLKMKESP
jgi:RNA polymerase sigma factor for flagellar operon FliA